MDKQFKAYVTKLIVSTLLGIFIGLVAGAFCTANAADTKTNMLKAAKIYTSTVDPLERVVKLTDFVATLSDEELTRAQTAAIYCMGEADFGTESSKFYNLLVKVMLDDQIERLTR